MTMRPVIFGETLFDVFGEEQAVLGGAPFNVAWHLQAFGVAPLLVSRVGDDARGRHILSVMQAWGMDCSGVQVDSEHETGVVNITLRGTEPAYDIVTDVAFDHIDANRLPATGRESILYHGTLACRNSVSGEALSTLKRLTAGPRFVDVNLRFPHYNVEDTLSLSRDADWLKLNAAEFRELARLGVEPFEAATADTLVGAFQEQHNIQAVIITMAEEGARVFRRSGQTCAIQPAAAVEVVDSVGAGDAFSSVMLLAQIKDWPLDLALARAGAFAESVLGIRGATIEDREFYRPRLVEWGLE